MPQSSIIMGDRFLSVAEDAKYYALRYFMLLPMPYIPLARLHYLDGLSADQISHLLGITPAAVGRRIKFVIDRLRFLLLMPSLNPLQVRRDFEMLFPRDLFEVAYHLYWEIARTGRTGSDRKAATQLHQIMSHLGSVLDEAPTAPSFNSMPAEMDVNQLGHLASTYQSWLMVGFGVMTS